MRIDVGTVAQVAAALFTALAAWAAWRAARTSQRQVEAQARLTRIRDLEKVHELLMELGLVQLGEPVHEYGKLFRLQHRLRAALALLPDVPLGNCHRISLLNPGDVRSLEAPLDHARREVHEVLRREATGPSAATD